MINTLLCRWVSHGPHRMRVEAPGAAGKAWEYLCIARVCLPWIQSLSPKKAKWKGGVGPRPTSQWHLRALQVPGIAGRPQLPSSKTDLQSLLTPVLQATCLFVFIATQEKHVVAVILGESTGTVWYKPSEQHPCSSQQTMSSQLPQKTPKFPDRPAEKQVLQMAVAE